MRAYTLYSGFICEIDYSSGTASRKTANWLQRKCFSANLSPENAAATLMEGVQTMKVSAFSMLEALACLEANAQVCEMSGSAYARF